MIINKVVFFGDCIDNGYDKRIKEFIAEGYNVELYTFTYRDDDVGKLKDYSVHHLKHYQTPPPYHTRLKDYTFSIRRIIQGYDKKTTLFYFFTLNTAFASLLSRGIRFIFEEQDMLFDRMGNRITKSIVKSINKHIINKSTLTVFTSEGFAVYYFGDKVPPKIIVIPNKVSKECLSLNPIKNKTLDFNHLRFGFVGGVRYDSLYSFALILASKFPSYEFHFYGTVIGFSQQQVETLAAFKNVTFHGKFVAPTDFPNIYGNLDFVVATYDTAELNPKYAEPNKLYESIFFEVPIIVSNNSFLADKVTRLGTGFDVDPYDVDDIVEKVSNINKKTYSNYLNAIHAIPKEEVVNSNESFFKRIKELN